MRERAEERAHERESWRERAGERELVREREPEEERQIGSGRGREVVRQMEIVAAGESDRGRERGRE